MITMTIKFGDLNARKVLKLDNALSSADKISFNYLVDKVGISNKKCNAVQRLFFNLIYS